MANIRPIYQTFENSGSAELGKKIFLKNKSFYHSIAANMFRKDLKLTD
jgi:hypothetical protein